jgi:DNA-binding MarR family transcriptional regulator
MAAATQPGSGQITAFSNPHEEALLTLLRSADTLQHALQQRLKPYGLTPTQYNVLRILRGARPRGLTCSAIGHSMITPEPDITRLLTRLKKQKLLCQQRDPNDRRVVWTQISPEGLALLASLDPIVERAPKEMLRPLTGADLKELTGLLRKISTCGPESCPASQLTAQPHSAQSRLHPHRPE